MGDEKFSGKWLSRWKTVEDASSSVKKTLQRVEDFGCEVMLISADRVTPSFAYTVGIFDVISMPEIITVGLQSDVSHHALNEAFQRMRSGFDLLRGRHPGIVGDVDVEFVQSIRSDSITSCCAQTGFTTAKMYRFFK